MSLREHSFFVKGPKLFNKLPKELAEFPCKDKKNPKISTNLFKRKLDAYLSKIPDQPNLSGDYSRRMVGIDKDCRRTNSILRIN